MAISIAGVSVLPSFWLAVAKAWLIATDPLALNVIAGYSALYRSSRGSASALIFGISEAKSIPGRRNITEMAVAVASSLMRLLRISIRFKATFFAAVASLSVTIDGLGIKSSTTIVSPSA